MSKIKKKKHRKLTTKAMFGTLFILAFIVVFVCIGITWYYIEISGESYEKTSYSLTHLFSKYIDGDKTSEYFRTGKKDAYYKQVQDFLCLMKSESKMKYVYVFVPLDDEVVYIWDTDSKSGGNALGIRQAYEEDFKEAAMKAFSKNPEEEMLVTRSEGYELLVTAISPIYNKKGDPVALVAVDVEGDNFIMKIIDFNLSALVIVLLASIIPIIIFFKKTKKGVLLPIKQLNSAAKEMVNDLESNKLASIDIHTGDEIEELADSFEQMSVELQDYIKKLSHATAERERISAELSMAKDIQEGQLPNIFPAFSDKKEFDIYASMTPAKAVGGDFYDFFFVDDDHFALVIADVSGKGIPASLFMMISKILIKNRLLAGDSPSAALEKVNNQLIETNSEKSKQFVTVWLAVIELSTGKGKAANAGHEHPVLKKADGLYELEKYRHSPPVSLVKGMKFREHSFELNSGDRLFVYTDGVAEAMNEEHELFGTDRLLEILNKDADAAPKEVLENVIEGISEFTGDAEQFDDITMISFTYFGSNESKDTESDKTEE